MVSKLEKKILLHISESEEKQLVIGETDPTQNSTYLLRNIKELSLQIGKIS